MKLESPDLGCYVTLWCGNRSKGASQGLNQGSRDDRHGWKGGGDGNRFRRLKFLEFGHHEIWFSLNRPTAFHDLLRSFVRRAPRETWVSGDHPTALASSPKDGSRGLGLERALVHLVCLRRFGLIWWWVHDVGIDICTLGPTGSAGDRAGSKVAEVSCTQPLASKATRKGHVGEFLVSQKRPKRGSGRLALRVRGEDTRGRQVMRGTLVGSCRDGDDREGPAGSRRAGVDGRGWRTGMVFFWEDCAHDRGYRVWSTEGIKGDNRVGVEGLTHA